MLWGEQDGLAPEVTRQRLFFETMESVLCDTSKVIMDQDSGNSMMYLPLDQLMKTQPRAANDMPLDLGTTVVTPNMSQLPANGTNQSNRNTRRWRGR